MNIDSAALSAPLTGALPADLDGGTETVDPPAPQRRRWALRRLRQRHRRHAAWALSTLLALALFALWPQLDLLISRALMDAAGPGTARFAYGEWPPVRWVYWAVPSIGRAALVVCLALICVPALRRSRRAGLTRWRGRAPLILLVLVVGLWWVVNAGFKEHWGRPRPMQVRELGGDVPFRAITQPSSLCGSNCSFPTGHAATGFALMAAGLRAPAWRRRRWAWAGLGCGLLIGLGRMVQGGHFASDVVFAGLMIWGISLAVQRAAVAWRRRAVHRTARPPSQGPGAAAGRTP